MNSEFSFLLAKTALRHYYVLSFLIDGTFYNFSVTRNVGMIHAKNCEKLPDFVTVMAKILSVSFSRHGVDDIQYNCYCLLAIQYQSLLCTVHST